MAVSDNLRLVVKVCKLYYEDNMNQKEISAILDVSRPQICRILNYAKENDIVNISINNPFNTEIDAEQALMKAYNLKDAFVTDVYGLSSEEKAQKFAAQCACQLKNYIPNNALVGVMSGKTIAAVASALHKLERDNLEFVPLVGGLGVKGNDWNANVIALTLAQKSNGRYNILNAPILVQSEESRRILLNEPSIAHVLEKGEKCDVALVGIGQISAKSTTYQSGAFCEEDIDDLIKAGAVASVCVSYLDKDGHCIQTPLTGRSIGSQLFSNRKTKVVAIATGNSKVESVKAALKSGYIHVLMTTLDLAKKLL